MATFSSLFYDDFMQINHFPSAENFQKIFDEIFAQGFILLPNFLSSFQVEDILKYAHKCPLKPAGVGKNIHMKNSPAANVHPSIRSDEIYWLNLDSDILHFPKSLNDYLAFIEALQRALNQECFSGAKFFECHFAKYAEGSAYAKHLDQHRGSNERILTIILYLNQFSPLREECIQNGGGEIQIYCREQPQEIFTKIPPLSGSLLMFFSGEIYHEVLPTNFERWSLTGWLRQS